MENKSQNVVTAIIVLIAAISLIAVFVIKLNNEKPNELAKVEIKEYKGQNLSSVNDLRENSLKGPQYIDIKKYRLKIDGLVKKTAELTYKQVLENKKYSKVVKLHCVEGWDATILWEGVLMKDILDKAGLMPTAVTVIFYSADGFSTSLPLKTILDKKMILAYKMNGIVLPVERGYPFQIIAEDKLGYKWAKWITHIEVSDNADYRGYWESRGFSNDADVAD